MAEPRSRVVELADTQLAASNASDLDAFCGCYHDDVVVMNGEERAYSGISTFRERYRSLFERLEFGAEVPRRLDAGHHCVDYERWWRIDPDSDERSEGEVLVRYTLRDDKIGWVQFLRL